MPYKSPNLCSLLCFNVFYSNIPTYVKTVKQYIILAALSQSLEYQAISDKTREGKVFVYLYMCLCTCLYLFLIYGCYKGCIMSHVLVTSILQILEMTLAVCINLLYHVALLVIQQHFIICILFEYSFY